MKRKIGLMTIHATANYGSLLQAGALAAVLQQYGDVEIVDYRPLAVRIGYLQDLAPYQVKRRRLNPEVVAFWHKNSKVKKSMRDILPLSSRHLRRPGRDAFAQYNILVAGSDEIWSANLGWQPQYFLSGSDALNRRVAYAPSIGRSDAFPGGGRAGVELRKFDSVLVRDTATQRACEAAGRPADSVVCDPVLLAGPLYLDSLAQDVRIPRAPYTLVYNEACRSDDRVLTAVREIGAPEHLVSVGFPYPGAENRIASSVEELTGLVRGADCVVTSMYHGLLLGLVFQKPVVALANPIKSRKINDLLPRIGADSHQGAGYQVVLGAATLADFRTHSIAQLTKALI